ncbi:MAG: LVIVD repeat-containing protein [Planctomycetota bacterium]|jgi:hypothetical protein
MNLSRPARSFLPVTGLIAMFVTTAASACDADCNGNGIPDADDIADGTSLDLDGDGVPDECGCVPAILGTLVLPGSSLAIAAAPNLVCVLTTDQLLTIDVADPTQPTVVGTLAIHVRDTAKMEREGDLVFVTDAWAHGLNIIDITDPTAPFLRGTAREGTGYHWLNDIDVVGDIVHALGEYDGGHVMYDVSIPEQPVYVGSAIGESGFGTVVVEGDLICFRGTPLTDVAMCLDMSDPSAPVYLYFGWLGGDDLVLRDGVAFANPPFGLMQIIDLNAPEPVPTDVCGAPSGPQLVLDGDRAYYAPRTTSIAALDVSDAASPTVAGAWPMPSWSGTDFDVRDGILYRIDLDIGGLSIADLTCGTASCPADIDASGAIDFADLLGVLSSWGPCDACPADLDGDGAVGFTDLLAVLSAWGPCAS